MDNARFHKKSVIEEIIKDTEHEVLFLPPYSPDFNPIETVFANIKNRRRVDPSCPLETLVNMYGNYLE